MTAARLLQQAVDQGCTSACVRLADLLLGVGGSYSNYDESGYQGVPLDDESGVRLMALAAEAGHPLAQYNVGFMLSRGTNGLKRRPLAAMAWFAHAVSNGNEAAKKEYALTDASLMSLGLDFNESALKSVLNKVPTAASVMQAMSRGRRTGTGTVKLE